MAWAILNKSIQIGPSRNLKEEEPHIRIQNVEKLECNFVKLSLDLWVDEEDRRVRGATKKIFVGHDYRYFEVRDFE